MTIRDDDPRVASRTKQKVQLFDHALERNFDPILKQKHNFNECKISLLPSRSCLGNP